MRGGAMGALAELTEMASRGMGRRAKGEGGLRAVQ
jgi:hypothetical protein